MTEFERTRQSVGSRTILITSWFDESQQTWRASAPEYSYLSDLMAAARGTYVSRKAALDRLCSMLTQHFASSDSQPTH